MWMYFHAKWNPTCEEIEGKYQQLCQAEGGWVHYKIDSDLHQRIKFIYAIRTEPSFMLFLNGTFMKRIVGYNFDHIREVMKHVRDSHTSGFDYVEGTKDAWLDYEKQLDAQERKVSLRVNISCVF